MDYTRQTIPYVFYTRIISGGSYGRGFSSMVLPQNYGGKITAISTAGTVSSGTVPQIKISSQNGKEIGRIPVLLAGSPFPDDDGAMVPPFPSIFGNNPDQNYNKVFKAKNPNQPLSVPFELPYSSGLNIELLTTSEDISIVDIAFFCTLEMRTGL